MSRMFDDPNGLMSKANIRDQWESPIQVTLMKDIENAIREQQTDAVMAEISQRIGIQIDEKKLLAALSYSHQSWLDGYAAGQRDAVKHGHWIITEDAYGRKYGVCSECGNKDNVNTAVLGHYCWFCGAKMDEEVKE